MWTKTLNIKIRFPQPFHLKIARSRLFFGKLPGKVSIFYAETEQICGFFYMGKNVGYIAMIRFAFGWA